MQTLLRCILLLRSIAILSVTGCGGEAPKLPAPAAPPPDAQDAGVVAARDAERLRRRASSSNTILTGPTGVTSAAPVQMKTLLGS